MSATREISLDTLDRLNEIKADLCTVQAAIEGYPEQETLVCIAGTLYRVIERLDDALQTCGEDEAVAS